MALRRMVLKAVLLSSMMSLAGLSYGSAAELAPYKDELFQYPGILQTGDSGDYLVVDYDEMRDINGRDQIPERRVKQAYVSLQPKRSQKDLVFRTSGSGVKAMVVGDIGDRPALVVIYLHGQGGNRQQGMNDYTFGGNFNRLKNLMARNDGVYISPDFTDFGSKGEEEIASLIGYVAGQAPSARIIIACGSMGGQLCWRVAANQQAGQSIAGLVLLGSLWDEDFIGSSAYKRRVPVFFGHGSRDPVFAVEKQEAFYRKLRSGAKNYPVRFHRFEGGNHGTPIRMTDWRATLNWMLSKAP